MAGHESANSDFCDICGTRIDGSPAFGLDRMAGKHRGPDRGTVSEGRTCPGCGAMVSGQFCDACGLRIRVRSPFSTYSQPPEAFPPEQFPSAGASSGPPESLFPPISGPGMSSSPWGPAEPPSSWSPPPPESKPRVTQAEAPPADPWFGSPAVRPRAETPPVVAPVEPPAPAPAQASVSAPVAAPARVEPPPAPMPEPAPRASSAPPTRPIPSLAVTWTVLVASDRAYYDRMKLVRDQRGPAVTFPAHPSERRIRLSGSQMRIGRRSATRELKPEIDLADRPADPGVSRLHAVLIAAPDGTWSILDSGSANGTLLNGREIPAGEQVPLHEGDRINLGAWTVISVHRA